jgi:hypothetical protein
MTHKDDFISIEEKIQKRIIEDRNKEYGDYQENFALLAELFSIVCLIRLNCTNTRRCGTCYDGT